MPYQVNHQTIYTYDREVFLEPQTIRLVPLSSAHIRVDDFTVRFDPMPSGYAIIDDAYGNQVINAWFSGKTKGLKIETQATVHNSRNNPFNFLILQGTQRLPFDYSLIEQPAIGPYLMLPTDIKDITELQAFADRVDDECDGDTVSYLCQLNTDLKAMMDVIYRELGEPWSADQTMKAKTGSCRDLAMVYVTLARLKGIAARFVSGYCASPDEHGQFELHAWAEVFLPGVGWLGFDPNAGIATGDTYFPVASGPLSECAAPVEGNFRGDGAVADLKAHVDIKDLTELTPRASA